MRYLLLVLLLFSPLSLIPGCDNDDQNQQDPRDDAPPPPPAGPPAFLCFQFVSGQWLVYDVEVRRRQIFMSGPNTHDFEATAKERVFLFVFDAAQGDQLACLLMRLKESVEVTKLLVRKEDALKELGPELKKSLLQPRARLFLFALDPARGLRLTQAAHGTVLDELEALFFAAWNLPAREIPRNRGWELEQVRSGDVIAHLSALYKGMHPLSPDQESSDQEPSERAAVVDYTVEASLAIPAAQMPYFLGYIKWHDTGIISTKGAPPRESIVRLWLEPERGLPVKIETREMTRIDPQDHVWQDDRVERTYTLAEAPVLPPEQKSRLQEQARGAAAALRLGEEKRFVEGVRLLADLQRQEGEESPWKGALRQLMYSYENQLPLKNRTVPELESGAWLEEEGPESLEALRGKVLLLDVWHSDYIPSKENTRAIVKLERDYRGKGVRVLGLTADEVIGHRQTPEQMKRFVLDQNVAYPNYVTDGGFLTARYQVGGLPYTILVDKKGVVRWHGSIQQTAEQQTPIEKWIDMLLEEE